MFKNALGSCNAGEQESIAHSSECTCLVYIYGLYRPDQSDAVAEPQRQLFTTKEQGYDKTSVELLTENLTNIRAELNYCVVKFIRVIWSRRLDLDDCVDLHPPNAYRFLLRAIRLDVLIISSYTPLFHLLLLQTSFRLVFQIL